MNGGTEIDRGRDGDGGSERIMGKMRWWGRSHHMAQETEKGIKGRGDLDDGNRYYVNYKDDGGRV